MRTSNSPNIVDVRLYVDIFWKIEKWLLNCTFQTWFRLYTKNFAMRPAQITFIEHNFHSKRQQKEIETDSVQNEQLQTFQNISALNAE